jgi:hypothetical protein
LVRPVSSCSPSATERDVVSPTVYEQPGQLPIARLSVPFAPRGVVPEGSGGGVGDHPSSLAQLVIEIAQLCNSSWSAVYSIPRSVVSGVQQLAPGSPNCCKANKLTSARLLTRIFDSSGNY